MPYVHHSCAFKRVIISLLVELISCPSTYGQLATIVTRYIAATAAMSLAPRAPLRFVSPPGHFVYASLTIIYAPIRIFNDRFGRYTAG